MTRKQFMAVLAKYPGVTLDTESEHHSDMLILDSPKGKIFAANGAHVIVEPFANAGGQSWKPAAYAEAARMLEHGLYDCDETDCETCEDK
jgi:hypothetical protein